MKRFTLGERRGAIALLSVMIVLAVFLIFNKGQQYTAVPEAIADTAIINNGKISFADSLRTTKKKSKKGTKRKKPTKKGNTPSGHSRNYLDENA